MKNKKGFEFSFGWIFALIVGAAILAMAIYVAIGLVKNDKNLDSAFSAKELGIILTPLETGLESFNKPQAISFPVKTRIYNDCEEKGDFGYQEISLAIESGLGDTWEKPGIPSKFANKYIFSDSTIETKSASVFSKPLVMPYKIADVIYMISSEEKLCLVNAPEYIEEEFKDLELKNVNITLKPSDCLKTAKKICFGVSGCDVEVDLNAQKVKKNKVVVSYALDKESAFLYGAIFSDPAIYECQVKRIMKRSGALANLYIQKSEAIASKGCSSNLEADLSFYQNMSFSLKNSLDLLKIELASKELGGRNDALSCNLF